MLKSYSLGIRRNSDQTAYVLDWHKSFLIMLRVLVRDIPWDVPRRTLTLHSDIAITHRSCALSAPILELHIQRRGATDLDNRLAHRHKEVHREERDPSSLGPCPTKTATMPVMKPPAREHKWPMVATHRWPVVAAHRWQVVVALHAGRVKVSVLVWVRQTAATEH